MSVGEEVRMNPPPHKRWRPSEELEELEKNLKTKEISAEEFDTFLALLLNLGIAPQPTLRHYWKAPSADTSTGSLFFSPRMSQRRWMQILQCLDYAQKTLVKLIRHRIQNLWNPSSDMCLDESMVPHQGMNNPHHMFIQRKPHPHGLKYYTIADKHGNIWNLKLHGRTAFDTTEVNDPLLFTKGKDHGWTRDPNQTQNSLLTWWSPCSEDSSVGLTLS